MTEDQTVVYIVDDVPKSRNALSRVMRSAGFGAITHASTHHFLKADFPDASGCLVFDVHLPEFNGLDLQRRLSEIGVDLPVIFITGRDNIQLAFQAMKAGASELLTKPFRNQDLLRAIQEA